MTNKFRLGGMTIEKGERYSGEDVLRLLKLSFENGKKKAQIDTHSIETVAFGDGYRAGYDNGVRDTEIKTQTSASLFGSGGGFSEVTNNDTRTSRSPNQSKTTSYDSASD